MTRKTLAALVVAVLTGCGMANSAFVRKNYTTGASMEATVGSPMLIYLSGVRNDVYGTEWNSFQQELIYGGVANDVVKVSYREFAASQAVGMLARPAFSQDLQYDLKQSKTIMFRDARLEVIDASNSRIAYRVLVGLGPDAPPPPPTARP